MITMNNNKKKKTGYVQEEYLYFYDGNHLRRRSSLDVICW